MELHDRPRQLPEIDVREAARAYELGRRKRRSPSDWVSRLGSKKVLGETGNLTE
jgi:hypothetical protein